MINVEKAQNWLKIFAQKVEENADKLSQLDEPIGDADHGNNLNRGMQAVLEALNKENDPDLNTVFRDTAMALISKVGGASGPLYGTAFLEMAKKAKETSNLFELLQAALTGMEKRGNSHPGQKSLLDVWQPVCEAVKNQQLTDGVIEDSVNKTKPMLATVGRASYLGDRSIGHIDPGAASSGLLFQAMLEAGINA